MADTCFWSDEVGAIETCGELSSALFTEVAAFQGDYAANSALGEGWDSSLAISGTIVAVGSDSEPSTGQGAVYIYEKDAGTWSYSTKLFASDAANYDYFGRAVGASGEYVIVGASSNDDSGNSSGSAYVFFRNSGAWDTQVKITASDAAANDNFGNAVAISGDYAVVGAYGNSDAGSQSGSAYIFHRSGGSWPQQAKIVASDASSGDIFGVTVDIDGDTAIIGAYYSGAAEYDAGAAYVFTRSGSSWTQQQQLLASDAADSDRFGLSVLVRGEYAAVSSESGVYIFQRSGTVWTEEYKFIPDYITTSRAESISLSNDAQYAVICWQNADYDGYNTYVYERSGATWNLLEEIVASNYMDLGNFGTAQALSGDSLVIGTTNNEEITQDLQITIFEKEPPAGP